MYQIPTKSDVIDKTYQKAVDINRLKEQLNFTSLFWDTTASNALHALQRNEDINTAELKQKYVIRANIFQRKLVEAKEKGYLIDKIITDWSSVHPNMVSIKDASSGTTTHQQRKRTLDLELVSVKPMSKWQRNKIPYSALVIQPVNYSFNPSKLAMSEIVQYIAALQGVDTCTENLQAPLKSIEVIAQQFYDNANLIIFQNNLFKKYDTPSAIEEKKGTVAYKLKQEHNKIAEKSDIYVRFDETYLVIKIAKGENLIPLSSIKVNEETRTDAAELIKQLLDTKGKIIVNGKEFFDLETTLAFFNP